MKIKLLSLIVMMLGISVHIRAELIDMLRQGAKGDAKTLNTAVINKTIAKLAQKGGGTLYFPAGNYLTGPIKLENNITLHLESGATLLFSDEFDHYMPFTEMRYEGVMMNSFHPLIYAVDAENISITGRGCLDGQGKKWWLEMYRHELAWRDEGKTNISKYQTLWDKVNDAGKLRAETNSDWHKNLEYRFFRPPFIQMLHCKNILIEGVTIKNSPFWTVNPEFCENITIKGVTVENPDSPNTDGINPSSCKYVHISDCHISVGDDCITLKSGRDLQARKIGVPCENITITNCTMLSGHGGVVIGSEVSGDVRKVAISNCVFDGTDRGIRLKSTRGRGGIVEEITVSNIIMKNIQKEAIVFNLMYSNMPQEPVSERTPVFRNIHISGLYGTQVKQAVKVLGIPEMPISDISLRDIFIQSETGAFFEFVDGLEMSNVRIDNKVGSPFVLKSVNEGILNNLRTDLPVANTSVIEIENCKDLFITGCFPKKGSKSFIAESGKNENVVLSGNNTDRLN